MISAININFTGTKYVIGHKNPDTDSICSAIAYSKLSEKTMPEDKFIPIAAGDINKETEFALAYFNIKPPKVKKDLSLKIKDICKMRPTQDISISKNGSLRELYNLMYNSNLEEVPVLNQDGSLAGTVTPKDIMKFNLIKDDVLETLKHKDITFEKLKTLLDADVLAGEEFLNNTLEGNVKMGVYSCDTTRKSTLKDAMVLVGDREDIQFEVINHGAKALVITKNKQPSDKIINLAKEKGLIILSTSHGTSSSAKLIEQSYPVRDIMNKDVVFFDINDKLEDIKIKAKESNRPTFPVIDNGKFVGLVTLDEILKPEEKELILVDHNSQGQFAQGIKKDNIKGIIDHHRQEFISNDERIPVNYSNLGATATMIAKSYKADSVNIPKDMAGILWCAIVSDTDNFTSVTTTEQDIKIAKELAKIAQIDDEQKLAKQLLAQRDVALNGLSVKELIGYDKKKYPVLGREFAISQILTFEKDKYLEKKVELKKQLDTFDMAENLATSSLMVTDMLSKNTYLFCSANFKDHAQKILNQNNEEFLSNTIKDTQITYKDALEQIVQNNEVILKNVGSRKEQIEPFVKNILAESLI